jgi:outer membrane protein
LLHQKPYMTPRLLLPLCLVNLVVLLVVLYLQLRTPDQIVYVDSTKLLNEYKGMLDARKAYQEKATVWKANIDTLSNEVEDAIKKYEKESSKLSVKERKLSEELIRMKQKQLMEYQQAMNNQAQQEDQKMTGDVLTQVNAYLKKYGEEKGYKIVMAATQYGNIAYADEKLDITKEVLEGLNKQYSGQ